MFRLVELFVSIEAEPVEKPKKTVSQAAKELRERIFNEDPREKLERLTGIKFITRRDKKPPRPT
jgi:hypothetical protein